MAFLSIRYYDNIVIIGTSMVGSYCAVRGFSFFIPDSFPSEYKIIDLISKGELSPYFYLYVAGFLALCAAGIIYQLKLRSYESINNYTKLR